MFEPFFCTSTSKVLGICYNLEAEGEVFLCTN